MKAVEKERLEKWREIYNFAQMIAAYEPWELFAEENTFALVPKGTRNEHYFSFLAESSGQCGIAIYPSGNTYVAAQFRLHGANPKREPLFDLQDAVILLWGDREDVSKDNYELIKALEDVLDDQENTTENDRRAEMTFDTTFVRCTGNKFLIRNVVKDFEYYDDLMYIAYQIHSEKQRIKSLKEHKEIIDLIKEKRDDEFPAMMTKHYQDVVIGD